MCSGLGVDWAGAWALGLPWVWGGRVVVEGRPSVGVVVQGGEGWLLRVASSRMIVFLSVQCLMGLLRV